MKRKWIRFISCAVLLSCVFSMTGCLPQETETSEIVLGEWKENVFTNEWSGIQFTLPEDFTSQSLGDLPTYKDQKFDLLLLHSDETTNISLLYVDLLYAGKPDMTASAYLETVRTQLKTSETKDFVFEETFEKTIIADEEFVSMRSEFSFKDPENNTKGYQDGYARKAGGVIIVFIASYSEETKQSVDGFFQSIVSPS